MTTVCLSEFVRTLSPLFSNLNEEDLTHIYSKSSVICRTSLKEFEYIRRKDGLVKRTVFILPKRRCFYICLKKKDIDHVNKTLVSIRQSKQLGKILGTLAELGFITEVGRHNTCNPIICINLSKRPAFQVKAKVTRPVSNPNVVVGYQETLKEINEEMRFRESYNNNPHVPKLEFHSLYIGTHKNKKWLKHLEISEMLDRDLHRMIHTVKVPYTKCERYQILSQIIHVLDDLHKSGAVYGDVKPENIYITRDEHAKIVAKLGDFGHVRAIHKLKGINGTPNYWAPEHMRYHLTKDPNDQNEIQFATDIWCIGWVLVHLFSLKVPEWYQKQLLFLKTSTRGVYSRYIESFNEYDSRPCPSVENLPDYLLWNCWRKDPDERMKAEDLLHMISTRAG